MWLPLMRPLLGTRPATQVCALTGNRTGDPLVCRLVLSPLSHSSQGNSCFSKEVRIKAPFFVWLTWPPSDCLCSGKPAVLVAAELCAVSQPSVAAETQATGTEMFGVEAMTQQPQSTIG